LRCGVADRSAYATVGPNSPWTGSYAGRGDIRCGFDQSARLGVEVARAGDTARIAGLARSGPRAAIAFHVGPQLVDTWLRYTWSSSQRTAALKSQATTVSLWDPDSAKAAQRHHRVEGQAHGASAAVLTDRRQCTQRSRGRTPLSARLESGAHAGRCTQRIAGCG
jgi:hypothetical protein